MYLEILTTKDPKKVSFLCLHDVFPILRQLPKFDAMIHQLTDNDLVNNIRSAIKSGIDHLIRTKAAKIAAKARDSDIDIDLDGDVLSVK